MYSVYIVFTVFALCLQGVYIVFTVFALYLRCLYSVYCVCIVLCVFLFFALCLQGVYIVFTVFMLCFHCLKCLHCAYSVYSVYIMFTVCAEGFEDDGSGGCIPCGQGTDKDRVGNMKCLQCVYSVHIVFRVENMKCFRCLQCVYNVFTVCVEGFEDDGSGGCIPCSVGTFKDKVGNMKCLQCIYSVFISCLHYIYSVNIVFTVCAEGFEDDGSGGCIPCSVGTFKDKVGNMKCKNCTDVKPWSTTLAVGANSTDLCGMYYLIVLIHLLVTLL